LGTPAERLIATAIISESNFNTSARLRPMAKRITLKMGDEMKPRNVLDGSNIRNWLKSFLNEC
jgi:hypothetical protein